MVINQNDYKDLLAVIENLMTEEYTDAISAVINFTLATTDTDGCFYFTCSDTFLNLEGLNIRSLEKTTVTPEISALFPSRSINEIRARKLRTPEEICFLNKDLVKTANLYIEKDLNSSAYLSFDELSSYATVSMLGIPLIGHKDNILGVICFVNNQNTSGRSISFSTEVQNELTTLCRLITLILENKKSNEDYSRLLESFIEVLARAIDAKSPYTGAHCQRVPIITRMLATAAIEQNSGKLKDFNMNEDDLYALHIASWLHDCGKITTPEYVVDKASKLEGIFNRIHEIRDRFEILRRDAHIRYLQKRLQNTDSQENLQTEFIETVKKLEDDFAFIARCNIGDNRLTDEDVERLQKLSKITYTRYFNRMLGLSWSERERIDNPDEQSAPGTEYVLQNRPDQHVGIYNYGELYNLSTLKGTINKEEREKINEHIVVTINMLKALPFPKELRNVVEYAGAHHERVDGKGYPNGLKGSQMSVPAKIMAIADIFEALTASDRPYKEPKKLSEVLTIMQDMKNNGHIDPDLYEIFINSKVYMEYALQYLKSSQIDEIKPEDYL